MIDYETLIYDVIKPLSLIDWMLCVANDECTF